MTSDPEASRPAEQHTLGELSAEEVFGGHLGGKLTVSSTAPLDDQRALSIAYTPGVARVSRVIADDDGVALQYTWAGRLVAVVSDGSAVLGLGNVGARAALPVMEGKAALFKEFGGLDAIPVVIDTNDPDEIVETLIRTRLSFGAVNLEDISAPRCFEIERRVTEALDCPVMHDDQHGTAIVVLAALKGAARTLGRDPAGMRMVIAGAGAAGVACARIMEAIGVRDVTVVDSRGILVRGRGDLTGVKADIAARTNPEGRTGGIAEAMDGADVYIGVSTGTLDEAVVATMAPDAIVFALSNPTPEVHPEVARKHAAVVATGRSDFPNQINNVLAFPGVFRGALDVGSTRITENMKVAAADALVGVLADELSSQHVIVSPLDARVGPAVAYAVARAAIDDGVATRPDGADARNGVAG